MRRRAAFTALLVVIMTLLVACSKRSPSIVDPKGTEAHKIADVW